MIGLRLRHPIQGVFVIGNKKAEFVPVIPGIAGAVINGLRNGDEIITGSYKTLRTLRSGSGVKIDHSISKKEDDEA